MTDKVQKISKMSHHHQKPLDLAIVPIHVFRFVNFSRIIMTVFRTEMYMEIDYRKHYNGVPVLCFAVTKSQFAEFAHLHR
jgi:hypothetical protein